MVSATPAEGPGERDDVVALATSPMPRLFIARKMARESTGPEWMTDTSTALSWSGLLVVGGFVVVLIPVGVRLKTFGPLTPSLGIIGRPLIAARRPSVIDPWIPAASCIAPFSCVVVAVSKFASTKSGTAMRKDWPVATLFRAPNVSGSASTALAILVCTTPIALVS
jgi:hypothetical protein